MDLVYKIIHALPGTDNVLDYNVPRIFSIVYCLLLDLKPESASALYVIPVPIVSHGDQYTPSEPRTQNPR